MAKQIKQIVKIQIKGAEATPAPPIGTMLGPTGISTADFCTKFNAATKDNKGEIIPVVLNIYNDRTFTFVLKTSPASFLIKKAAKIEKGSGKNLIKKVGKITKEDVKKIAEKKMEDLNARSIDEAMKIIEGTARSMGIEVV